ncbi:MAG: glutamate-1-semialdehyde 2,1-aminomutase [Anaerostipes faecalis]|nr:glutamate-1-semialdehyde 2,1-aminomutase [Anaerostipes faecalis]
MDQGRGIIMETKSRELFERARKHMPGGVNSPVRAFGAVGGTPRFIASASKDRVVDVDGNEYIDYVCSWGPGILGHAHPRVIEKVQEACEKGLTFGAPTEREVILAEMISELMPSMEVSRLVNSGTEAVMSAIRAARGYTKRDKIIKFKGCYHGHSDGLLVKAGSAALTTSVPDSAGVPADYTKNTLVAAYNDRRSVEELLEANPEEIAAVIVEPVAANMGVVLPEDGFLQFLRDITEKYGSLLIFDEVITGFRLALGGAQEYYQVTPDLTTLGKIVGGGMPMGAYGGKREIMRMVSPDGPVYQAGTLSGNPVATAAGIETLKILKEDPAIYQRLEIKTKKLAQAVKEAAGDKVYVNQIGSLMSVFFTSREVKNYEDAVSSDTEKYARYFQDMLERGIYLAPAQFEAMFVSDAHTEDDIEKTCHMMKESLCSLDL